jgi:hypothetical protein
LGIGGGIITKKLLFVALLIASLSLGGIATASAAEVDATQIQTSNTNTLIKNEKNQLKSENISKNSTKTQKSVDKSVKTVKKIDDKKQKTTQNKNIEKPEEIKTCENSTNVQKSKKVVKTNVVSSSTVKQENINDANTSINIQNQNTVQNTSNVKNDAKKSDNNASVTNETTQTQIDSSNTKEDANSTSNIQTTANNPVIRQKTENNQSLDSKTSVSNSTINNQSTVNNTTNNNEQLAAASEVFTSDQIATAATWVKNYVDTNKKLPDYVTINNINVSMPSFLQLLTTATLNINNKNLNSVIYLYTCGNAPNPRDSMQSGSMSTAEYLKIAGDVKSFMDSKLVAPEYAYGTSLGSYFGYENMIYAYSKILDYYNQNKILPSSVDVKQWIYPNAVPIELIPYTQSSANCQSNDASIKALATSITQNYATTYDKAVAIFNWVRDNLNYSFYYNTKYGAVGALNARTGNCVDTAHLVVALSRAAGLPAKYIHGTCQFSSGAWYGHVWAQVWVNGKWYTADATSSRNSFGVVKSWTSATIKGTYTSLPF